MPKGPQISETQKVAVALLLSEQTPPSQAKIGEQLGMSPAAVSRARTEMLGRKVLVERGLDFDKTKVSAEDYESARRLVRPASPLQEALAGVGTHDDVTPTVHVVPSSELSDTARPLRVGEQAAPYVLGLLRQGSPTVIGVAWGASVAGLIDGLQTVGRAPSNATWGTSLRVIPLSGEGIGKPLRLSSTSLAERLFNCLVGDPPDDKVPSLSSIPAFIPWRFGSSQWTVLDEFIHLSDPYKIIFGGDGHGFPLVENLDVVITGVSPSDEPLGYMAADLLATTGIDSRHLRAAVGDIGGVFLPREGALEADRRILDDIRRQWTGMQLHHLQKCAKRARSGDVAGVVVVASGPKKAECVWAAVKNGLINHLIIDASLEQALIDKTASMTTT